MQVLRYLWKTCIVKSFCATIKKSTVMKTEFITHLWCDSCNRVELHQVKYIGAKISKDKPNVLVNIFCVRCYRKNEVIGKQTYYTTIQLPLHSYNFLQRFPDYYGEIDL